MLIKITETYKYCWYCYVSATIWLYITWNYGESLLISIRMSVKVAVPDTVIFFSLFYLSSNWEPHLKFWHFLLTVYLPSNGKSHSMWLVCFLLKCPTQLVAIAMSFKQTTPGSKDHVAKMGSTWGRQVPGGPHLGPMDLTIRDILGSDKGNLTHWPPGDVEVILLVYFSNSFYELISWTLPLILILD